MKSLKVIIAQTLLKFLSAKGTLVAKEQKAARLKVCDKCPKMGPVNINYHGFTYTDPYGCQHCGCLLNVKAALKTLGRVHPDDPLSVDEVLEILSTQQQLVDMPIACELGYWSQVDKSFLT